MRGFCLTQRRRDAKNRQGFILFLCVAFASSRLYVKYLLLLFALACGVALTKISHHNYEIEY